MAPSHHVGFRGASIPNYTHFETPLGEVKVSDAAPQMRKESKLISAIDLIEEKSIHSKYSCPSCRKRSETITNLSQS